MNCFFRLDKLYLETEFCFAVKNTKNRKKFHFLPILSQFTQNLDYTNFTNGIVFTKKKFSECVHCTSEKKKSDFLSNNVISVCKQRTMINNKSAR